MLLHTGTQYTLRAASGTTLRRVADTHLLHGICTMLKARNRPRGHRGGLGDKSGLSGVKVRM